MRSRLTGRSVYRGKLPKIHDPQGFERYVNPSNGGRRVDVVRGEVRYESPGRGREQAWRLNLY